MYTRVIIFIIMETEKVLVFIILSPLKYQVGFHPKTYFHMLKDHHCYDHKDLHLSQVKKKKKKMKVKWFVFSLVLTYWIAEQTLHGHLVWNFSSAGIKNYIVYFTWLQTLKEKFCTYMLSCNILYVSWAWRYIIWKTHLYSSHHLPSEWQEAAVFCSSVTIKFYIWLLKIKGATLQRKLVVRVQGSG